MESRFIHFIFYLLIIWFIISIVLGILILVQYQDYEKELQCIEHYNYSNKYNCEYILCLSQNQDNQFDMEFMRYNFYTCTMEAEKDKLSQFSLT